MVKPDTSSLPHSKAATPVNAYRRLIGNCRETTRIDRQSDRQIVREKRGQSDTQSLNHLSISWFALPSVTQTHLSYSCPIFETGAALCGHQIYPWQDPVLLVQQACRKLAEDMAMRKCRGVESTIWNQRLVDLCDWSTTSACFFTNSSFQYLFDSSAICKHVIR